VKWELELVVINQPAPGDINQLLTRWGANGWELVNHTAPSQEHTDRWTFAFKRPVSDG
jgi:hypothetical protein